MEHLSPPIIPQATIHKVLSHEGILGRGRDFITNTPNTLHLYTDKNKRSYVMQQYTNVSRQFYQDKINNLWFKSLQNYVGNIVKVCFFSVNAVTQQNPHNKNQQNDQEQKQNQYDDVDPQSQTNLIPQFSIFYDTTSIYGFSLQSLIKTKINNEQRFQEDQIYGFFWQIADFLLLNGSKTGEFLEITPINIFCKVQEFYGYNFFPNNFGVTYPQNLGGKCYHNPEDRFWQGNRTPQTALSSTMFTLGMVLLQLCSLLPPTSLFESGKISQKSLKKRIEGIKITNNSTICSLVSCLLSMQQQNRLTLDSVYQNQQLLRIRKVLYVGKGDRDGKQFKAFKEFKGLVSYDKKEAIGEGVASNNVKQKGRFVNGVLQSGVKFLGDRMEIGHFSNQQLIDGVVVNKQGVYIGQWKSQKGIFLASQQFNQQNEGKVPLNSIPQQNKENKLCAFEGAFQNMTPLQGKCYFSNGQQSYL